MYYPVPHVNKALALNGRNTQMGGNTSEYTPQSIPEAFACPTTFGIGHMEQLTSAE